MQRSPVQVAVATNSETQHNQGVQIAFPPNIFSEEHKQHILNILMANEHVEAAAIGATSQANTSQNPSWLKTIFLRVNQIEHQEQIMQKFCTDLKKLITQNTTLFNEDDTSFEIGVMLDPNFWLAVHQNNFILFDKNPPHITSKSIENT